MISYKFFIKAELIRPPIKWIKQLYWGYPFFLNKTCLWYIKKTWHFLPLNAFNMKIWQIKQLLNHFFLYPNLPKMSFVILRNIKFFANLTTYSHNQIIHKAFVAPYQTRHCRSWCVWQWNLLLWKLTKMCLLHTKGMINKVPNLPNMQDPVRQIIFKYDRHNIYVSIYIYLCACITVKHQVTFICQTHL